MAKDANEDLRELMKKEVQKKRKGLEEYDQAKGEELFEAIKIEKYEEAKKLLENSSTDVNYEDWEESKTPLRLAIEKGRKLIEALEKKEFEEAKKLLQDPETQVNDVLSPEEGDRWAASLAIKNNRPELLDMILTRFLEDDNNYGINLNELEMYQNIAKQQDSSEINSILKNFESALKSSDDYPQLGYYDPSPFQYSAMPLKNQSQSFTQIEEDLTNKNIDSLLAKPTFSKEQNNENLTPKFLEYINSRAGNHNLTSDTALKSNSQSPEKELKEHEVKATLISALEKLVTTNILNELKQGRLHEEFVTFKLNLQSSATTNDIKKNTLELQKWCNEKEQQKHSPTLKNFFNYVKYTCKTLLSTGQNRDGAKDKMKFYKDALQNSDKHVQEALSKIKGVIEEHKGDFSVPSNKNDPQKQR